MKLIRVLILVAIAMYLTGSFMCASLNLSSWDSSIRQGIGIAYIFVMVLSLVAYAIHNAGKS